VLGGLFTNSENVPREMARKIVEKVEEVKTGIDLNSGGKFALKSQV
jgi:hypothetical protein